MFRVRWVLTGFLILPLAELAVFLAVAAKIGLLAALSIMLATSLGGAAVIRGAGREPRSRFRASAGRHTPDASFPGFFTVIAGILLLVPGFLTDCAGALLLVPAVQRRLLALVRRGLDRPSGGSVPVVELGPDEWRRVGDHEAAGKDPKRGAAPDSCPSAPAVLATPPESGVAASRVKEER
jgi:UPF0716 protein FxsA